MLRGRVGEIGQQGEEQVVVERAQVVLFELPQQRLDLVCVGQERRDGDQRRALARDAVLKLHLDQQARRHQARDDRVHQAHGHADGRDDTEQQDHDELQVRAAPRRGDRHQGSQAEHEEQQDAAQVAPKRVHIEPPAQAQAGRRGVAQAAFQGLQPAIEQVEPHVTGAFAEQRRRVWLALTGRCALPVGGPARSQRPAGWTQVRPRSFGGHRLAALGASPAVAGGQGDGLLGDGFFRLARRPRQAFDDFAVAIARLEVHPGVHLGRVLAQDLFDPADVFEDGLPVLDVDGTQVENAAGDRRKLGPTPRARLRARCLRSVGRSSEECGDCLAEAVEHTHPKCRRQGPQFPDRQRGHALVGDDKAADGIRIEVDLAGRDQFGRQDADSRQSGERRFGQHRKLAIEPGRHVLPHLADDLTDQVVVVQQPLGAGWDFQLLIGEAGEVSLGAQEQRFKFPQPMQEVDPIRLAAQDGPGGEPARQVLQAGSLDPRRFVGSRLSDGIQRTLALRQASMVPELPGGQLGGGGLNRMSRQVLDDQQWRVAVEDERVRQAPVRPTRSPE